MNSITEALNRAITHKDALDTQPSYLEVPSQQFAQVREDLGTSENEDIKFTRVGEMIASEVSALPDSNDVGRLMRMRSILSIAAAAMPHQELTPATDLLEEYRAANATIDVLQDEKQQLRDQLVDANDTIERLQGLMQISARRVANNEAIQHILALTASSQDAARRINAVYDRTTQTISQVPYGRAS